MFRRGKKIVAHCKTCSEKECREDELRITLRQAARLLDGKLRKITNTSGIVYDVSYPDKTTVKIGCTSLPMKEVRKIRKFMYE